VCSDRRRTYLHSGGISLVTRLLASWVRHGSTPYNHVASTWSELLASLVRHRRICYTITWR